MRILFCAISLLSLLLRADPAASASVKKKNGQTVKGEISGRLVQKGKLPPDSGYTYVYFIVEGRNVTVIDEAGVHLDEGAKVIMIGVRGAASPDDWESVAVGYGFAERMTGSGAWGRISVTGECCGIRVIDAKAIADKLLGEFRVSPKTEVTPFKAELMPFVELKTQGGIMRIPIAEIVEIRSPVKP